MFQNLLFIFQTTHNIIVTHIDGLFLSLVITLILFIKLMLILKLMLFVFVSVVLLRDVILIKVYL